MTDDSKRCCFEPGTANTKFRQHPYRCHCGERDLHLASIKTAWKIFMGKLLALVCSTVTILCFHSVALQAGRQLLVFPWRSFTGEAGARGCSRGVPGAERRVSPRHRCPCPLPVLPSAGRAPRAPSPAAAALSPLAGAVRRGPGGRTAAAPAPAPRRAPALNAGRHRRSCRPQHRAWNTQPAAMVEAFCATWKLVDSHNFDEYMKALGRYGRSAAY